MRRHLEDMTSTPVSIVIERNIYRVQVGPFKDLAAARRASQHLKAIGIDNKTVREGYNYT
jgi:cell division protein FtsN